MVQLKPLVGNLRYVLPTRLPIVVCVTSIVKNTFELQIGFVGVDSADHSTCNAPLCQSEQAQTHSKTRVPLPAHTIS